MKPESSYLAAITAALQKSAEAVLSAEKKANSRPVRKAAPVESGEPDISAMPDFCPPDFEGLIEFPTSKRKKKDEPAEPPKPPRFEDLSGLLDGSIPQEMPTVARVSETRALFYAGSVNEIHGEPSVGKTNILVAAVIPILLAGGKVLILDPEDTARGFISKLRALSCDNPAVLQAVRDGLLHYVHNPEPSEFPALQAWAIENKPALVGLDGLAEALASEGLNEDVAGDVLSFFRRQIRPFAEQAGAAVLIADHVAKAGTTGNWSRGSGAKLGRYDGVSYSVKLGQAYSPTVAGHVKLTVAKDRKGGVGPKNAHVATLFFSPADNGTETRWEDVAPVAVETGKPEFRPTEAMNRIIATLAVNGAMSANELCDEIKMSRTHILQARTILLKEKRVLKDEKGKLRLPKTDEDNGEEINPEDYKE